MSVLGVSVLAEALARVARDNPGACAVRIMWAELVAAWHDALADPARPAPWLQRR